MRKLIFILALVALATSCQSGKKEQLMPTKQIETGRLKVQLKSGNSLQYGDSIVIGFDSSEKIDSLQVFVNSKKEDAKVSGNNLCIATSQMTVGQKSITIEAFVGAQKRLYGYALLNLKSDIAPQMFKYKVVKQQKHNEQYYTQGLEFDGADLYEGTGLEGVSALYKVDAKTYKVLKVVDLPSNLFGEGISIMGNKIYQLTWRSQIGFIYNKQTFEQLGTFNYGTEGWGLTNNGKHLIMSDGTEHLYFIDTATMQEVRRIEVMNNQQSVQLLNELEYVDGLIYANVYCSNTIVAIDEKTGRVMKQIDMSGLSDQMKANNRIDVLNGIAYRHDTKQWFVTGKLWPSMFEVEFVKQ